MYVFSLKLLLKNTTLSVVQGRIGWDCLGAALSCVSLGSSSRARGQEKHFQCSQGAERTFTQGELSSGCRIHSKGNSLTWIPDKEKHFEEHFPPSSAPLKSLAASLATSVQVRCTSVHPLHLKEGTHSIPDVNIQYLWLRILSNTTMTTHFMAPVAVGRHRCVTGIWLLCIILAT